MKRNKSKQLEFWYKLAKSLALVGILFWLLESTYFTITDGWHWLTLNPLEIWADRIVYTFLNGMVFCLLMCLTELIEGEISLRRSWEGIVKKMDSEDADKILAGLTDEDLEPLEKSAIRNPKSAIE